MSRTKRPAYSPLFWVAIIGTTIGLVAGCSSPQASQAEEPPRPFLTEHYQKLPDGRVVLCLVRHNEVVGGYSNVRSSIAVIDCDWASAKIQP